MDADRARDLKGLSDPLLLGALYGAASARLRLARVSNRSKHPVSGLMPQSEQNSDGEGEFSKTSPVLKSQRRGEGIP
jgi:hypothetical protein